MKCVAWKFDSIKMRCYPGMYYPHAKWKMYAWKFNYGFVDPFNYYLTNCRCTDAWHLASRKPNQYESNKIVMEFRARKTLSNQHDNIIIIFTLMPPPPPPSATPITLSDWAPSRQQSAFNATQKTLNVCTIITDDNCYDVFNLCATHEHKARIFWS